MAPRCRQRLIAPEQRQHFEGDLPLKVWLEEQGLLEKKA